MSLYDRPWIFFAAMSALCALAAWAHHEVGDSIEVWAAGVTGAAHATAAVLFATRYAKDRP